MKKGENRGSNKGRPNRFRKKSNADSIIIIDNSSITSIKTFNDKYGRTTKIWPQWKDLLIFLADIIKHIIATIIAAIILFYLGYAN